MAVSHLDEGNVEKAVEAIDAEQAIAETDKDAGLKAGFNALNNLNFAMIRVRRRRC